MASQFGTKAPEKIQRLFFMLRDNDEVLNVFLENILDYVCENKSGQHLSEFIVHHMFLNLSSSEPNLKLSHVIETLTSLTFVTPLADSEEMDYYHKQNNLVNFRQMLFTQMTGSLDAKQCAQSMFM